MAQNIFVHTHAYRGKIREIVGDIRKYAAAEIFIIGFSN